MGVKASDMIHDGPNGEKMSDYKIGLISLRDYLMKPYRYQLPSYKEKVWYYHLIHKRYTGGEKWMKPGYKTETPGQLSNEDKAKRAKWRSIEELRAAGELKSEPKMGYYWENGVRKWGERHPNYGK